MQVAAAQHRRKRGLRPAGERPDPRHQLRERKRLGKVVVSPQAEADHPVLDPARRGQHQHAGAVLLLDERRADTVSVDAREVAVEHDHVVAVDRHVLERGRPVEHDVDGHALAPQTGRDRLRKLLLILDH